MAITSDEITSVCSHCDRPIPSSNIDLHYVHCFRNLEKCKVCAEMISRRQIEDHYLENHAPVPCSLCGELMERERLASHKEEKCPQRIIACEFCDFPLPATDLAEHQEVCGNRTELCPACRKYIRLRERSSHESKCSGLVQYAGEAGRGDGGGRRPPAAYLRRRLLFGIAVAGIAVLLGSFLLPKKSERRAGN